MITPASIRNNNPGAMYPGKSARKFGSRTHEVLRSRDGAHKIATFPTAVHGAAAQFDLLAAKYCGMTVEAAVTKWCGSYHAGVYLKVLEDKAGVKPTDELTLAMVKDPARAIPLAKAMAWQEAGREFPFDDAGWRDAHEMAFGGAVAPAFAPDNDVPVRKLEDRRADVVKIVSAGGGIASVGVSAIPSPPTEALGLASAWRAFGGQVVEFGQWAWANPTTVGIVGVVIAALLAVPRLFGGEQS